MSWSSSFIAELNKPHSRRWYVSIDDRTNGYGDPWQAGSDPFLCPDPSVGVRNLQTQKQSLTPRTWETTLGGFSFEVVGEMGKSLSALVRGALVYLYVGTEGMTPSQFERVAVGAIVDVEGRKGTRAIESLVVTVQDLPYALQCRQTADIGAHPLFYQTSATAALTASEAVGSGTYDVDSTGSFNRPTAGTYPYGYILVETDVGDAYYRRYSATTGTTFTIQDAATVGLVGTSDIGASSTNVIREAWGLRGHPLDIVRQLLVSRGDGLGGPYDVYPAGWGFRISEHLVDIDDMSTFKASDILAPSSGAYEWEIAGVDKVEDGWSWLSDLLTRGGFFLAMRQGSITCRPVQSPKGLRIHSGVNLDDNEIAEVLAYSAYDSRVSPEYYNIEVVTYTSGSFTDSSVTMSTLPAGNTYTYDQSDRLFNNGTAIASVDLARLKFAVTTVPEVVRLRMAGLRCAQLTLGDIVTLSTRLCPARDGRGMYGRDCMVNGIRVEWVGGTVELDLTVWPGGVGTQ